MEQGFLTSGASTKNAGFSCLESISELIEQEKIIGTDGLYNLIGKRLRGLKKLKQLLGDEAIDYRNYGVFGLFKPAEKELSSLCVSKFSHYNKL